MSEYRGGCGNSDCNAFAKVCYSDKRCKSGFRMATDEEKAARAKMNAEFMARFRESTGY